MTFARRLRAWLGVAMVLAASLAGAGERALLKQLGDAAVLPLHRDFAHSTAALAEAVNGFCQGGKRSAEALAQVREHWREAMRDWAGVNLFNFGPITVDNLAWRFQFWPDRKNIIHRQASALLKGEEPISAATLQAGSVVLQGLSLLEYLLFDEQAGQRERYLDEGGARRCAFLRAAAQLTRDNAADLLAAWSPAQGNYLAVFTAVGDAPAAAGAGAGALLDSRAALAAVLDALVAGAEVVHNRKLAIPLGYRARGEIPQPYAVEAWRSGESLALLRAQLAAMQRLYHSGLHAYLRAVDEAALAKTLARQFEQVLAAVDAVQPPLFEAVNEPEQREALSGLYEASGALLEALKNRLPAALGVRLGFNANDGD